MSYLTYIASDALLKQVVNPHYKQLSINEALEIGMDIPEFLLESGVDKNEPDILLWSDTEIIIDIEQHTFDDGGVYDDFAIFPIEKTADILSEKRFYACLEWQYTEERANKVVQYIKEHLEHTDEVEVWRIWMGSDYPQRISKSRIPADKLTTEDVRKIDSLDPWVEKRAMPSMKLKARDLRITDKSDEAREPTVHYCLTVFTV